MKPNVLIIHPCDNVAVALRPLAAGETALADMGRTFAVVEDVSASHKIALRDIAAEAEIIKYGETVAVSTRAITQGQWVHTHNLEAGRWKR